MKPKAVKLWSVVLSAAFITSLLFTACGKKNASTPETSNPAGTAKAYQPISMTMAFRGSPKEFMGNAQELMKRKMKERYNVDWKFDFIDTNNYKEKLKVMIAASEYPEFVWMGGTEDKAQLVQAAEAGMILPVTDIYKNDPDWKKVDPKIYKTATFKGEIYGIVDGGVWPITTYYRADWAKKLNIKAPTNPDEVYQMLYAFTKNDPDGNGKNDTFGIAIQGNLDQTSPLWQMFLPASPTGTGIYIDEKDNTVKSSYYLKDDVITALNWFNKAYKEGVIEKEFILAKATDVEEKFVSGRAGAWSKGVLLIAPRYEKMKANNKDVDITSIPTIKGKYGPQYTADSGGGNVYSLTNKCKDKERGMKVLAYFRSPEGSQDQRMGEEGVTWKLDNGKLVWTNPDDGKNYNPGNLLTSVHSMKLVEPVPVIERNIEAAKGFAIKPDMSFVADSEVNNNKAADVKKVGVEWMVKFIVGQEPISKYDNMIQDLKKAGLDDILTDVNKTYKAQK